ncbi:MAG: hypothetical protein WBP55_03405 [Solirubrobacterales bacterium]
MTLEERSRNRDGTAMSSNEYVGFVLAVIVPLIGLLFGLYMKSEGNPYGGRIVLVSLISAAIWLILVLAL